ncbi:hypothetical protein PMG71_09600 [Roseofilum sp. BLCC_M154]|uniref:Uncharacterized protein n=1 Tax=Roseofilum acuticapitatum BLCC-M154 TaxID=3022444 RepID=A0ABT7ARZ9_9CYAN|nr:hypothetical protein [Roseofilum acuticapitatum]MDJ1169680.1 hypothetical protein [Roseofilum acuticapitatum BLCC-M154]
MSDGIYFSAQIVAQLLHQKIITVEFDQGGVVYRLESGKILAATPRSGKDEAKRSYRGKVDRLLTPKPKTNPYAGRGLAKKELVATGHFTHKQIRSILPGQRVADRFGFWWQRIDTPNRPGRDQRGFRNGRGRLMASYIGLASESDNWERYSEELVRLI